MARQIKREILKATFSHIVAVEGRVVIQIRRFDSGKQYTQRYTFDTYSEANHYGMALCGKIG
jgi:hypothetical protein